MKVRELPSIIIITIIYWLALMILWVWDHKKMKKIKRIFCLWKHRNKIWVILPNCLIWSMKDRANIYGLIQSEESFHWMFPTSKWWDSATYWWAWTWEGMPYFTANTFPKHLALGFCMQGRTPNIRSRIVTAWAFSKH